MKRTTAALLWFYTGWTAGAFAEYIAAQNGVTIGPAFGLVLGTAAAALFAGDPRRLIWNRPRVITARPAASPVHSPA
jgi:hypothetical protein